LYEDERESVLCKVKREGNWIKLGQIVPYHEVL